MYGCGCGEQEVGVASGSGWNLWVWLLGVVVRRYIDFLILLIPTPLVSVLFAAASLLFFHFVLIFFPSLYTVSYTHLSYRLLNCSCVSECIYVYSVLINLLM